mgnify:CR=1 FL=1
MAQTADHKADRSRLTRRGLGVLAAGGLVGGGVFAANWFNVGASLDGATLLSVQDAHDAALSGAVVLVDIRRPDEWATTGIGEGAVPLDMRRDDFVTALSALADGETAAPVALICARGVRSKRLSGRLAAAGFTNIIDVPEGMLGSGAGPGWLRAGLPVVQVETG